MHVLHNDPCPASYAAAASSFFKIGLRALAGRKGLSASLGREKRDQCRSEGVHLYLSFRLGLYGVRPRRFLTQGDDSQQ